MSPLCLCDFIHSSVVHYILICYISVLCYSQKHQMLDCVKALYCWLFFCLLISAVLIGSVVLMWLISCVPHTDASSESFLRRETAADDGRLFSAEPESDEGLELQGAELQLQGAELLPEREEFLMSISTRLQSAVEKLLIAITETSTQVQKSPETHKPLGFCSSGALILQKSSNKCWSFELSIHL